MIKKDELECENSCLNKATDDEMLFVLLARDPAFYHTVMFWAAERVRLKLNNWDDPKIREAINSALIARGV